MQKKPAKPATTASVPAPQSETLNPFDLTSLLAEYDDKPAAEPTQKPAPKVAAATAADDDDEPAVPAKKTYEHSAKALRKGKEVGLTDEEMAGMELDDLADEIVFRHQTARYQAEGAAKAAIEAGRAKTSQEPDLQPAPKAHDFGGASLDDVDDEIVKAMKHMASRLAALEGELAGTRKSLNDRAAKTVFDQLDALYTANPSVFGDKPSARTEEDSDEADRRRAVYDALMRLKTKTTLEKDFAAVCKKLNFSAPAAADEDEEVAKWNASGLAKPSPRKDPPKPRGEARARESSVLANAMDRAGISVGGSNGVASLDDFAD